MTTVSTRARLLASVAAVAVAGFAASAGAQSYFERVATYPVYLNLPEGVDPATETVAEIVSATEDGLTLIYTDGAHEALGLVDITDPANPMGMGAVELGGEPTSVAVARGMALAGVNTSESYVDPSGHLAVVDIAAGTVVATCDLGGQPDSVAVSPDRTFVAVAIENERDEDLNDGVIPQLPAGALAVFALDDSGMPTDCDAVTLVDLTGLAEVAPSDPEPEYVAINGLNHAVVTMQENNHLAVVDLATGTVAAHFSGGTVDLDAIDTEDDGIVQGNSSLTAVPREADAVTWLGDTRFATADEGDYEGGSRTFTIYHTDGSVEFDTGNAFEHLGMSLGHYPDGRADNKGMEPEGITAGTYGDDDLIFVNSERGNIVAVYVDHGPEMAPTLHQVLPTAVAPEGLLTLADRDLFVVATEEDAADDKIRSTLTLYARTADASPYPHIVSHTDTATGAPIGWGALSGMVGAAEDAGTVYAVSDSFYAESRIYTVDAGVTPAEITSYVTLTVDGEAAGFDLEGIALAADGGFWVVSEGRLDRDRHNLLMAVDGDGTVTETVMLPEAFEATSVRFGFEGVTTMTGADGVEHVVVAIQREWGDDPENHVRLGFYDTATGDWTFAHTPIAAPSSPNGGWVGLSEITHLGEGRFLLIERDNQTGLQSTHKVLTVVSLGDATPVPFGETPPVLEREVVVDLLPLLNATNGWIGDKPEGVAVTADGTVWLVTDNDGVDDASGETLFLAVGTLDELM